MTKLFEVRIKPDTLKKRAQRHQEKLGTNVPKKSKPIENTVTYEPKEGSVTHPITDSGGKREGAGRKPKPTSLQKKIAKMDKWQKNSKDEVSKYIKILVDLVTY